jgi:hypothetical protein
MKLTLIIILLLPLQLLSQVLVEGSRARLQHADAEELILYTTPECQHCYYYLPSSLRISAGRGIPEASLVIIKDEVTSRPRGGVLHFLVEWGLKVGSESHVQRLLRSGHDSLAVIMGPVIIDVEARGASIEGNDRLASILTGCLKNRPAAPTTPGAKMALSFRFSEAEIGDFLFYVRHPEKAKASIKINYSYVVKTGRGGERRIGATLWLPFSDILKVLK